MNRCFTLAVSPAGASHCPIRVYGHGALLGTLTLRNEERACFEALFYDEKAETIRYRLRAGERVEGGMHLDGTGRETTSRFGCVAQRDSFVAIEPEKLCPVKAHKGEPDAYR